MSRLVFTSLGQSFNKLSISSRISLPSTIQVPKNLPCILSVRFYRPRKPFWLPIAKSKMFRVHKRPVIPKEDEVEISRLYYVYRTQMKSVKNFFKEQLMAQETAPEVIAERNLKLEEQYAECIQINDQWNKEVAKIRDERLANEAKVREEKILQKIMEEDKKHQELIAQIDAYVRNQKEAAKSFITSENIDEAIQVALSTTIDHNFAIDNEGNIYHGRYGKPSSPAWNKSQLEAIPTDSAGKEETKTAEARV